MYRISSRTLNHFPCPDLKFFRILFELESRQNLSTLKPQTPYRSFQNSQISKTNHLKLFKANYKLGKRNFWNIEELLVIIQKELITLFDHPLFNVFPKLLLIFGGIGGSMWAWYKGRLYWRLRQFDSHINFSLNMIEGGKLKIRTLFEKELNHVVLQNRVAAKRISKALKKTSPESPFLQLPEEDAWYILNLILNVISEVTAQGFLARDLKIPIKSDWYWFGLTYEQHSTSPSSFTKKIRVMIAKETLLEAILKDPTPPEFEIPYLQIRWKTLIQMAKLYSMEKNSKTRTHLMKIELTAQDPTSLLRKAELLSITQPEIPRIDEVSKIEILKEEALKDELLKK